MLVLSGLTLLLAVAAAWSAARIITAGAARPVSSLALASSASISTPYSISIPPGNRDFARFPTSCPCWKRNCVISSNGGMAFGSFIRYQRYLWHCSPATYFDFEIILFLSIYKYYYIEGIIYYYIIRFENDNSLSIIKTNMLMILPLFLFRVQVLLFSFHHQLILPTGAR